jgi:aspartyl-tRNA(Asn)/glutamyl-tRNA(Gln) amidotransferase subunit A
MATTPFPPIQQMLATIAKEPHKAEQWRQQAWQNLQQSQANYQAYREFTAPKDLGYQGLLNGISVSAKDLYGVDGMSTYAGSPYALEQYASNGPLVQALIDQGAHIIGKTHTVEFAFGGLGTNPHWPVPKNPTDSEVHRVPGGSSSGAPVSLLTNSCQLALGTDTAGSVRVPAAMCGTFGIKTSAGRWSKEQVVPLSPTVDTAGLLARTAADAAWGFAVMDPANQNNPLDLIERLYDNLREDLTGVKIGYIPQYFADCEDGIDGCVMAALYELVEAGAELVALDWPHLEQSYEFFIGGGLSALEFPQFIFAEENQQWFDALADSTKLRFMHLQNYDQNELQQEIEQRQQQIANMQQAAHACLAQVDFAVCPTVPISPPPLAQVSADMNAYKDRNSKALSHTQLVNYQNLCGATLPVGLNDQQLPAGLQIIMPHGEDEQLLQWSMIIEQLLTTSAK